MLSHLVALGVLLTSSAVIANYDPTWESIDSRPLPPWFDDSKIGIFLHWGVYAVPGRGEWFWSNWKGGNSYDVDFMKKFYPPDFTYADFARDFRAEFFNPAEWAEIFSQSGARYVVLTSKHHEGYTMWPSNYTYNWNAMDVGPKRDLLGELAAKVRAKNLKFGTYYSLFEWFNPIYLKDKNNKFETNEFVRNKMLPELKEMIMKYKPEVIWSDGDWEAKDSYFTSQEFLAWLYNESPVKDTVVTNDRWGQGTGCTHGGYFSCQDRYNPGTLQQHKWENAMTLDRSSWGYRRTASLSDYLTIGELLKTLASTISCGGNLLVNIGPTAYGKIPPIGEERLRQMGKWLQINGEAIYSSKPWVFQNDTLNPDVWYTTKSDDPDCTVYAIVLKWPGENTLRIRSPAVSSQTAVEMIGYSGQLKWTVEEDTRDLVIEFPNAAEVSKWAWVLRIKRLMNGCTPPPTAHRIHWANERSYFLQKMNIFTD
ncbi:alpha-L-fucosidase-like [Ischnura elegans]|uniref:alpha-L-fucosidase-like n=1 Tax=Ischnura elegans TaxID=197161 RepID=UPI001ED88512|nr:alpha-L-fucosidase-like [Ischnura elegans]